jgi:hypothetical protein
MAKAALRAIGEDVHDLARALPLLHLPPEADREQIGVLVQELVAEPSGRNEKGDELLREDVVLADVVPRLGRHLLVEVARLW